MPARLAIVIPTYQTVSTTFFANFIALSRKDIEIAATVISRGVYVASAMRGFVDQLRQREIDYDRMLVLESDMIPPHDALQRHAEYTEPIVGAAYFMHEYPHLPIFTAPDDEHDYHRTFSIREVHEMMENPGLYETMNVGFGCTSIRRDVLEEWPKDEHIFANRQGQSESGQLIELGHDVAFHLRARRLGWKSYVDTAVKCGHLTEVQTVFADHSRAALEIAEGKGPKSEYDESNWHTRLTQLAVTPAGEKYIDYVEPSQLGESTRCLNP